jgi:hypothetical protein
MPKKTDDGPLYRRIIADAWRVAWGHKHLWVFGFFAAMLGFGGVSDVFFNAYDRTAELIPSLAAGAPITDFIPGYTTMRALVTFSAYPALALLIFVAAAALLIAVFAWMTSTSVGGLIANVRKIARGGEPTFGEGLKAGSEKFLTVLAVIVISKLVIWTALALTGANLIVLMKDRTFTSGIFYVGSFVVFTAVAVGASLTAVYASNYAVIKGERVEKAMNSGWGLLTQHWLISLEMTVLLLLASLGMALVAALGSLALSVPLIFLVAVAAALKAQGLVVAVIGFTAALLLLVLVVLAAFLSSFQAAAWTLLWGELNDRRPLPKLLRIFRRA